jgi:hypothetical protein
MPEQEIQDPEIKCFKVEITRTQWASTVIEVDAVTPEDAKYKAMHKAVVLDDEFWKLFSVEKLQAEIV